MDKLTICIMVRLCRNLKLDGCHSNLYVLLNKLFFLFFKFYEFFCRQNSSMNRPCYNNLLQFIQHDNFRNLKRTIFTHWKHFESRVNPFWYLLSVIKVYTFYYFMKLAPILGNQGSVKISQLFECMALSKFSVLSFSSIVILF